MCERMAWEAVFEFFAGNPPSITIAGGILLLLVSALTAPIDASTTDTLQTAKVPSHNSGLRASGSTVV